MTRQRQTVALFGVLGLVHSAMAADDADALPFSDFNLADCALVEDGVQRLACYDALNRPGPARERATEAQKANARKATQSLTYSGNTNAIEQGDVTENGSGMADALIDRYLATERALFSFSGSFVTHRPTYILPYTYNGRPNNRPVTPSQPVTRYNEPLEREEAKYQISFKVPMLTGLFDDRTSLWFGYTQTSYWQVYNSEGSAPFRETNYEPEIFARYTSRWDIGPGRFEGVSVGINHESNGQPDPQSRSWNRIKGQIIYSLDRWLFAIEPWYRIPESDKDDDNPDISDYMGYANYWAIYKVSDDRTLSIKLLNNLSTDDNRTSVQLNYSFPIGDTLKGYVQYYNGFGESLVDYNRRVHRIGVGIMLNDWL
ncbi:phospholipase [Tamilnaduibacter salinus]|uniref:Phospholipase A1 n=1 Tax=Tamilnaduibacter salinus TaxID=1484056 RepID=A0A2A2I0F6_9GAMM|nr:phospholipase A [Tamilnaduibacter salinus]PAV24786.1 phospholipase [Tamilnaduibacter salinus]